MGMQYGIVKLIMLFYKIKNEEENLGIECQMCPSILKTKHLYDKHNFSHHVEINCNECNITVQGQIKLKRHNRKHLMRKICPNCKFDVASSHFTRHAKNCTGPKFTTGRTKYDCNTCSFVAASRKRLATHLKKHASKPQPDHQCSFCDYKSKRLDTKKRHEKTCKAKFENILFM